MRLRSLVQDALYLNWALPVAALPEPPEPLRYQTREGKDGEERAFASAILFRHRGLHLPHLPAVRLTYPQLNLRLYAVDADRVPSVLFLDMLMPWWVGPAVRLVAEGPASVARFDYPRPSLEPDAGEWRWRVRQGGVLEVAARRGAPEAGGETSLGTWAETVRFFRERPRGYLVSNGRLRRVETEHPRVEVWPLVAELGEHSLLESILPLGGAGWPRPHSAWLCPEIPFVFDLAVVPQVDLEATLPRAAASTRSACTRSTAGRVL
jgi:hypothetical protein